MIKVTFTDEIENITSNTQLYQWDIGQKLEIEGVKLTDTPVVHFANKKSDKALVIRPEISSNKLTVDIPNSLLQEPYPIIGYIYSYDENEGKTIKTVYIPIEPRVKPDDYVFEGDTGFITLAEMNSKLDAMIRQSTNDFNALMNQCETDYNNFINTKNKEIDDAIVDAEERYLSTINELSTGFTEVENIVDEMQTSVNNMQTSVNNMEGIVSNIEGSFGDLQALVNNMIVSGSYTGQLAVSNTTTERTINLGFKPKMLFVWGYLNSTKILNPIFCQITSDNNFTGYNKTGSGSPQLDSNYSKIEITNTGFKITAGKNDSSSASGYVYGYNSSAGIYYYKAIK